MTRKDETKSHGAAILLLIVLATLITSAMVTVIGSVQIAHRVHHLLQRMPAIAAQSRILVRGIAGKLAPG